MALLIYGLMRAGDTGWGNTGTALALAGGLVLLAVFVGIEPRIANPLPRSAVLARRPVIAGNLVMLVASGLPSNFFLCSQYLQHPLRLGALSTGLIFLPVAIVIGLSTHLGVRVASRGGGPAAAPGSRSLLPGQCRWRACPPTVTPCSTCRSGSPSPDSDSARHSSPRPQPPRPTSNISRPPA
jgi:hypothetical protein